MLHTVILQIINNDIQWPNRVHGWIKADPHWADVFSPESV